MMKKIRLFFILLVLVLLGTVHVKAQHTGSYQCTKIVEANGIMKKGDAPHIWYFTFNQRWCMNQISMGTLLKEDKCTPIFS